MIYRDCTAYKPMCSQLACPDREVLSYGGWQGLYGLQTHVFPAGMPRQGGFVVRRLVGTVRPTNPCVPSWHAQTGRFCRTEVGRDCTAYKPMCSQLACPDREVLSYGGWQGLYGLQTHVFPAGMPRQGGFVVRRLVGTVRPTNPCVPSWHAQTGRFCRTEVGRDCTAYKPMCSQLACPDREVLSYGGWQGLYGLQTHVFPAGMPRQGGFVVRRLVGTVRPTNPCVSQLAFPDKRGLSYRGQLYKYMMISRDYVAYQTHVFPTGIPGRFVLAR